MENVRSTAWRLLCRCSSAQQYSNIALDTAIQRGTLSDADRALLTVLVYGTIERRRTLDHWIAILSDRPIETLGEDVLSLLRMGLYQLAYLDRVPDHAAVNETVALAPRRARGFVNAILRSFLRKGKRLDAPDRNLFPAEFLAVTYSVGDGLCRRLLSVYGMERTEAILRAFGERSTEVTLRVNTQRVTREAYLRALEERGISALPTEHSRAGVVLRGAPVTALYGFAEGLFFVQDEASQRCVEALEAAPGMRVLDLCACPGSKSFGLAIEMNNEGELLACDLHANKLSLIQRGAERLGLSILQTAAADARISVPERVGYYDRVLCDVPCSGFGVLGKKPELRYKDPAEAAPLPEIQLAIAQTGATYLRVGGRMVYSTCTILPEENEGNVRRLLSARPELRLVREELLLPDTDRTDGFYFAVLERTR